MGSSAAGSPARSGSFNGATHGRERVRRDAVVLLLGVLMVPPCLVYLGLAYSMAAGMLLVSGALLLAPATGLQGSVTPRPPAPAGKAAKVAGVTVTLVLLHFLLAASRGPVDLLRGLASLPLLALLILAGADLANRLCALSEAGLRRGSLQAYAVLVAVALVGATGWGPPTLFEPWRRPVFPFFEPSAFALAFTPVLMIVAVTARGVERLGLLAAGLLIIALLPSATLASGLLLVITVILRPWALVVFGAPAAFALTYLDLTYFTDRIDLSGEGNNLSNLVYLQGWQMIEEAWELSGGLGIGFQQLGVQGTEVLAAQVLRALRDGEDMNLLDGSFVFVKLGADFGFFGAALTACFVLVALRSWFALRRAARGTVRKAPMAVLVAHASIVTFCIELFLRGTGYFTGTGLLACAALWVLAADRRVRLARSASRRR